MIKKCAYCGKEIYVKPCRNKERNYCCVKHQLTYEYKNGLRDKKKITKKANEAWIKLKKEQFKVNPKKYISKRGYWIISIPGKGRIKEHQYIWIKNYGKIPKGMDIHHINMNKLDNNIENLQMIPKKEHQKLHDRLRKRNKKGQYLSPVVELK